MIILAKIKLKIQSLKIHFSSSNKLIIFLLLNQHKQWL
jgi:hypothetical protein